jgi:hypothetical protein
MRIQSRSTTKTAPGYALALVMVMMGVSFLVLGGALSWSGSNTDMTARHNQYTKNLAAAEAATEKVISALSDDYRTQGQNLVAANMASYKTLVPTIAENPAWATFEFSDAQGHVGLNYVYSDTNWIYQALDGQYSGLNGYATLYKIISNVRQTNSRYAGIISAVKQGVYVASIPVFQFAIFYAVDLEINPGANMNVTGRVHSNADIFTEPSGSTTLNFASAVTAVGQIRAVKKTGDPSSRGSSYRVTYATNHPSGYNSLTLPIGTNNTPDAVHAILEVPPPTEDINSDMGKQRYYNKADLIVLTVGTNLVVKSGSFNNFATTIPVNQWSNNFITNTSFTDSREGKVVKAATLNVGLLKKWSETNTLIRGTLNRDIWSVYIADSRVATNSTTQMSGVKVMNGQVLPSLGLTVATPNPLYVQGHFNAPSSMLGTTNTANTEPASLVADAINILSTGWTDANSTSAVGSRVAANTTVNAAIIAGSVPTGGGYYSGGVENFPRFLETWSGKTITYNGSMVVMFNSKRATAPWGGSNVYSAPNRNWAFDVNFMDATKLPPGTPQVRALIRSVWRVVPPNSTL